MEIYNGGLSVDDRGRLAFVNDFDFKGVKRFYMVHNHSKGFVRAWHGHKKEGKYVFVVKGVAIVATVNMKTEEVERVVLSESQPQIVYIPPGYYNGFKTLTDDALIMFYSTSTMAQTQDDDFRQPAFRWREVWDVTER